MQSLFPGSLGDGLDAFPAAADDDMDLLLDLDGEGGCLPGSFAAFAQWLGTHGGGQSSSPNPGPAGQDGSQAAAGGAQAHPGSTQVTAAGQQELAEAASADAAAAAAGPTAGVKIEQLQATQGGAQGPQAAGVLGSSLLASGRQASGAAGSAATSLALHAVPGGPVAFAVAPPSSEHAQLMQQQQHHRICCHQQHYQAMAGLQQQQQLWGSSTGVMAPPAPQSPAGYHHAGMLQQQQQAMAAAGGGWMLHPLAAQSMMLQQQQQQALAMVQQHYAQQHYAQQQALVVASVSSLQGVVKVTAATRQQKVRRKNTVASLEADLTDKLSQLKLLAAENDALKLRAGVLEATVANREDQMRVVWEHGPPTFPIDLEGGTTAAAAAALPPAAVAAAEAAAATPSARDGQSAPDRGVGAMKRVQLQVPPGAGSEDGGSSAAPPGVSCPQTPSALRERTASTAVAGDGSSPAASSGDSPKSSSGNSDASGTGAGACATFDAHTARLPLPQQKASLLSIKAMTDGDVTRLWRQFLAEVTSELVALQREEAAAAAIAVAARSSSGSFVMPPPQPPFAAASGSAQQQQQQAAACGAEASSGCGVGGISACEARVRDLVDKACYLVRVSQTLNPSAYCRLFGRHLDTGEPLPYSDAHWRNVVAVLELSKAQLSHILACAELYFSARAKLQDDQRALQQQLRAAEHSPDALLSSSADNPLRPWLERLAASLKREHNLRIMLNSYVWGRIFSHVQKAKTAVYSHPFYPDIHALVCVMCEDAVASTRKQ